MLRSDRRGDAYKVFLESCNTNVNDPNYHGVRPIHLAATLSEHQVRKLINEGADPTLCTIEGLSPLHIACRFRQSDIVGLLVEEYIKLGQTQMIDLKDANGETALHHASRSGRVESVLILLALGAANVNVKNDEKMTPLDVCSEIPKEDTYWANSKVETHANRIRAVDTSLSDRDRPWYSGDIRKIDLESLKLKMRLTSLESVRLSDFSWDMVLIFHSCNDGNLHPLVLDFNGDT